MANALFVNMANGSRELRDLTSEEKATQKIGLAEYESHLAELQQAASDREAAKASALAKLEALGLTAEEAQAIAGI